jgi:hypothetical protein
MQRARLRREPFRQRSASATAKEEGVRRRTIQLRSGTWEWSVVDPDDPRARAWSRTTRSRAVAARLAEARPEAGSTDGNPAGAPPLPKRRIELRSTEDQRHCMSIGVPPHLGHAGDDAAVTMLALNPDRRIVVASDGTRWALWPVHEQSSAVANAALSGARTVRALPEGGRARTISLPEGLALGQLTDQEILDLLD